MKAYILVCLLCVVVHADNLFLPTDDPDLVDVPPFYDNIVRAQKELETDIVGTATNGGIKELTDILDAQFLNAELAPIISVQFKGGTVSDLLQLVGHSANLNFSIDSAISAAVGPVSFQQKTVADILRAICLSSTPPLALFKRFGAWHIVLRSSAMRLLSTNLDYEYDTRIIRKTLRIKNCLCDSALKVKIEQMWDKITGANNALWYCLIDDESRAIFAQGYPRHIEQLESFLECIDRCVPQVRIDAIVAVVDRKFEHNLGFNWGGIYNRQSSVGCFGFVGIGGKLTDFPTPPTGVNPETFAFHLFNKGLHTIRFPIVFGGPDLNTRRLNIEVNAADVNSHARILLRPSILTSHNETAEILIGESIPITTFVEDVIEGKVRNVETVNFKDVGTILHVKPLVLPDLSSVILDILVEDSSTTHIVDPKCPPVIKTIRTKNKVCLQNGQTIVIGGLTLSKQEFFDSNVPYIAQLPLIGWLFRGTRAMDEDNELLIFITPTITP